MIDRPGRIWVADVAERSMEPALRPGDRLLVLPAGPKGLPGLPGLPPIGRSAILARDGRFDVKRVAPPPPGVSGLWLLGDNAARSRDSRHDGALPLSGHRGRVIYRNGPGVRPCRNPSVPYDRALELRSRFRETAPLGGSMLPPASRSAQDSRALGPLRHTWHRVARTSSGRLQG